MKNRLLFFVTLLLPFLSFSQPYCKVCEKKDLVNGNGQIIEYGKPLWGYSYNSADTSNYGKITSITEYRNGKRNGRRIQFFSYPNDTASVVRYTNDTLDGAYFYNHTNGKVWTSGIYKMGGYGVAPSYWTEEGERINENLTYNESTRLYYLDDAICTGKVSLYGHGGLDNAHPRDIIWFTNGKIDSVYSYRWAYWGKSSEIHRNYIDSTRLYIPYAKGEKPMWLSSWKIDTIDCSFYRDGPDLFFRDRDKLIMHGLYITYHLNSDVIKEEGYYENGKQVGEWKYYDESGKLINTVKH